MNFRVKKFQDGVKLIGLAIVSREQRRKNLLKNKEVTRLIYIGYLQGKYDAVSCKEERTERELVDLIKLEL